MDNPAAQPNSHDRSLLSVDEARAQILGSVLPLATEHVPLLQAAGRFVMEPMLAEYSLPGFDNSAMDGYAVGLPPGLDELPRGTRLAVTGEQPAGPARGLRVVPGEAVRIFTGAPVPAGSDAVVMQEDVRREGDSIVLLEAATRGEFIRLAGGDLARGQKLCGTGDKLTPQRLALLASQGRAAVRVARAPRVAILATGDELRALGEPLGAGEIYESNSVGLAALAGALGASVTVLPRAKDERADLDEKLTAGLRGHEMLVIAGGVSVGERDYVKERLLAARVEIALWRIFMRPGKPFLYGRGPGEGGAHVFGLPGNPVSAFVTFLLFVRPAILRLLGASDRETGLPTVCATLAANLDNRGDRPHYVRGSLDAAGRFLTSGRQESHALYALSLSRALVRIEPGAALKAGEAVNAMLWD